MDEKGVVTIAVNAFGNLDSDGDISAKGAFKKTIKENFQRIKHLLNHNFSQLLGVPEELKETSEHLVAVSRMNMEKSLVKDVFSDYKFHAEMGRTLEHSIGFNVVKRDEKDPRIIKEYKLFEYSTLTFLGANENTPLLDLKNRDDIIDQIDFLTQALHKGQFTDEKFIHIEKRLEKLNQLFTQMKPSQKDTSEPIATEIASMLEKHLSKIKIAS